MSVQVTDGRGGNPIFHKIMDLFFFTAGNAQKIKVKSIFHKWEDQMI